MIKLENDSFGRTVMFTTDGITDTYSVQDGNGNQYFSQGFPAGTPQDQAYNTINAMASGN